MPKRIIMIDAGHGGRDPGAINKRLNLKEKDINLSVARFMKRYLLKRFPNETLPYLTRNTDSTVSLSNRCRIANNNGADVFLSIHTNARPAPGVYGIEVEAFHCKNSEHGKDLATFVLDRLLKALKSLTCWPASETAMKVINRGVKIGQRKGKDGTMKPFYVLKYTNMPAALIELGFISDDEEAKFLSVIQNRRMMAKALANGVMDYFL